MRAALVVTRPLALLVCLVAAGAGCSRHAEQTAPPPSGPQLVVRTVPAERARYNPDEYVQLVATRVHVSRQQRSAFWQSVGAYLRGPLDQRDPDRGRAGERQDASAPCPSPPSRRRRRAASRETSRRTSRSPRRFACSSSDQVTLQASLVEATEDTETKLVNAAKTIGGAASLPVSTVVPGGERGVRRRGAVLAARARRRQAAGRDAHARRRPRPPPLGARPHRAGVRRRPGALRRQPRAASRSQAPAGRRRSDLRRHPRRSPRPPLRPAARARRPVADAGQGRLLPGRDARGQRRAEDEELPAAAPVPAQRGRRQSRRTRRPS